MQLDLNHVQSNALFGGLFRRGLITLLCDGVAAVAKGLGVVVGRGGGGPRCLVPVLRLVCGVAGAELAFEGMGEGHGFRAV